MPILPAQTTPVPLARARAHPVLSRRPRAVLLDAGNTLVEIDYAEIATIAARSGVDVTAERLRWAEWRARVRLDQFIGPPPPGTAAVASQSRKSSETRDVFRRFMAMILEEAGLPVAGEVLEHVLDEIHERHRAHNIWNRPHPAAQRVLAALKAGGLKLAVVSNAGGDVADLLTRLGLAAHLDAILDSGLVGVEKPDPRIFHLAARDLGVVAADCVHVGDLYSVDVVGARAAGAEPVLLDPAGLWPHEDCVKVPDLTALVDLCTAARGAP